MKKYGKKLLGMLLCAVLVLGLAPRGISTAKAETVEYNLYIGGV